MATSSTRIPKPKDWQEFERQAEVLAQCWLNDPNAKGNGRQGQPQHGVDVYGRRDGRVMVGIQCKEKFESEVTEDELRNEVAKAEKFIPKLGEFILATTAGRDAKIQKVARSITAERSDFSVEVWGWEDIEQIVAAHPKAAKAFDPAYTPLISEEIRQASATSTDQVAILLSEVRSIKALVAGKSPEIVSEDNNSTERHGKISLIQSLIDEGDLITAVPLLSRLSEKEIDQATASEVYRIRIAQANIAIKRENFDEAGRILVQAATDHLEHKNAPSNLAIGHLLVGEARKAAVLSSEILFSDPTNQKMAETLAQARAYLHEPDPFFEIDPDLQQSSVMWGLRANVARQGGDPNWRQIAYEGVKHHQEDKFLRRASAEAVVEECVGEAPAFVVGEAAQSVSFDRVEEATSELVRQLDHLREIGGSVPAALAHNTAIACRLVDRFDDAVAILEAAARDHPDDVSLTEQVALHNVHHGDPNRAITLLKNIARTSAGELTLATAFIKTGRFADAKKQLDIQSFPLHGEASPFQFLGVWFEYFRCQRRAEDAVDFFHQLAHKNPSEPLPHLFAAKASRLRGDDAGHRAGVQAAHDLLPPDVTFSTVYELADEAFNGQLYDLAVDLLKDRVATDRENAPLSLCIAAAMNGDLHRTASDLLERVPDDVSGQRWFKRVNIALANKIGSAKTLGLLNAYLNQFPDDTEMRLLRIGIWQTRGETGKIRKDISDTPFDILAGRAAIRIQLFRVATAYGSGAVTVPRAYELLLENWDDIDCHLGYQSLFLSNDRIKGVDLAPDKVGLNCVFKVTNPNGERRFRIEEKRPATFADEWLPPKDDLAATFVNLASGDAVEIAGALDSLKNTVSEIKSVYLDTLHRSLNFFNERFPTSSAMLQMSIDPDADDPLVEMKKVMRQIGERDEQILRLYRENPIPIVWIASLLGKDEIDCAVGISSETGMNFRVCQGTGEERDAAFAVIRRNAQKGVVVDAFTAVLIKRLDVLAAVQSVCGQIYTTSTTIERLTERYHEAKGMIGRSKGSLGYKDGKYILTEYSRDHQEAALRIREEELEWVRQNIPTLPALPQRDLSKGSREVVEMVGANAVAPALAAGGADLPLLADDFGSRIWAKDALDVEGLWLQPVLMQAKKWGHLSEDDYAKAVLAMVDAGFSYVSLDAYTLMVALRVAEYEVGKIAKPLQLLCGMPGDIVNNLVIAAAVTNNMEHEPCPPLTKYRLASEIARLACYPRWKNTEAILSSFLLLITSKRGVMRTHLAQWLRGNSIGST